MSQRHLPRRRRVSVEAKAGIGFALFAALAFVVNLSIVGFVLYLLWRVVMHYT